MQRVQQSMSMNISMSMYSKSYALHMCVLCLSILMVSCVKPEQLRFEVKEAQRERDVLRVAYEAQQLRLKDLEARLALLEDHKESSHLGSLQPIRPLPTIRLRKPASRPSTAHATAVSKRITRQRAVDRPSSRKAQSSRESNVPTLSSTNIHLYDRQTNPKKVKAKSSPIPPPANASILGV